MATFLSLDQALPAEPRRVLIAGAPGAGKSTLARVLNARLGLPYTELDSLFHGPGWTQRPEFEAEVLALAAQERWVCEWQYSAVRPLLAERADTLVWLDYPRSLVMWRVIKRTVRRRVLGEVLWNGNRELSLWHSFTARTGIVRWAWETFAHTEERVLSLKEAGAELNIVRLRTPREAHRWTERNC